MAQAEAQQQAQMHAAVEQQQAQLRDQQAAMIMQAQERQAFTQIQQAAHQATGQQFYGGAPGSNRQQGPGQRGGPGRAAGAYGSKQWARSPGAPPSSVKPANAADSPKRADQGDWSSKIAYASLRNKYKKKFTKAQTADEQKMEQQTEQAALQNIRSPNEGEA